MNENAPLQDDRLRIATCRLRDALGIPLRVPIVQAVLGDCAGIRLLRAVDRAGALPTLSVAGWRPNQARRWFRRLEQAVGNRSIIAFTGDWEREEVLDEAFDAGFRVFQTFWWNSERLVPRIQKRGGRAVVQVGSMAQASEAIGRGANALLLQGVEAGGPVRSSVPLEDFLHQVRSDFGADPLLLAGGGLSTRDDVEWVIASGADAAVLGTRFLLSEESRANGRDKARLCAADSERLLLDTRLVGPWPCAPRRRLQTLPDDDRPGLFAGMGLGTMHRVEPVSDIVRKLLPNRPLHPC
ncbi:MAG: nitronate monooxygenase [Armatimonadaceae bacterium]|jgi:nitronate monooxygenase